MDKELKEWINKSLNETIADEEARALLKSFGMPFTAA